MPSLKITEEDIGFIPDELAMYRRNLRNWKNALKSLEKRYKVFSQQLQTFIKAIDNCRKLALEPTKPVTAIFQVEKYQKHFAENLTDRRVLKTFVDLVYDLDDLRQRLVKMTKRQDEKLEYIYTRWSKMLSLTMNITLLRTKKPNPLLNCLNHEQVSRHFGGIVSVIPAALEIAREGVKRMELIRGYKPHTSAAQEAVNRYIRFKLEKLGTLMDKYPSPKYNRSIKLII